MVRKISRAIGLLTAIWAMMIGLQALPQQAAATGKLFNKMRSALSYVVNPDTIELAAYTIDNSSNAASVFQHAVEQDYPYFGIITGIKYVRYKSEQGVKPFAGFNESQCNLPQYVADKAFDYVKIDSDSSSDTSLMVSRGKALAADYVNAATSDLKSQILEEMQEEIPYLADLKVMCHFAFHTDFKQVKDYFKLFDVALGAFVDSYHDFSDGNLEAGVTDLLTIGLKSDALCTLADDVLTGGLVEKIPVVGDLAVSVCSGALKFVADVIKGAVHFISDAGKTIEKVAIKAGCTVVSLLSSACDAPHIDWPAVTTKLYTTYCADHGGGLTAAVANMKNYLPQLTLYDNGYSKVVGDPAVFMCNDFSQCSIRDFAALDCTPASSFVAVQLSYKKKFLKYVAKLQSQFFVMADSAIKGCLDTICQNDITASKAGVSVFLQQTVDHLELPTPSAIYTVAQFKTVVDAQAMQFADLPLNAAMKAREGLVGKSVDTSRFHVLPARWRDRLKSDKPRCGDDQACRSGIDGIADATFAKIFADHAQKPALHYITITSFTYAKAFADADTLFVAARGKVSTAIADKAEAAAAAYEAAQIDTWGKQCQQATCLSAVKALANEARDTFLGREKSNPMMPPAMIGNQVSAIYDPQFEKLIADSKQPRDQGTERARPSYTRPTMEPFGRAPAALKASTPTPAVTAPARGASREAPPPTVAPPPAPAPTPLLRRFGLPRPMPSATPTPKP